MSDWPTWYLATQIGMLDGYDECQIEEHRARLEAEAAQAMAHSEPMLMEALDKAAAAWLAQKARRDAARRHWQRILAEMDEREQAQRKAPTVAPVEAR